MSTPPYIPQELSVALGVTRAGSYTDQRREMLLKIQEIIVNDLKTVLELDFDGHLLPRSSVATVVMRINAGHYWESMRATETMMFFSWTKEFHESSKTCTVPVGRGLNEWLANLDLSTFKGTEGAKLLSNKNRLLRNVSDFKLDVNSTWALPQDPFGASFVSRPQQLHIGADSPFLKTDIFGCPVVMGATFQQAAERMMCVLYNYKLLKGALTGLSFDNHRCKVQYQLILASMIRRALASSRIQDYFDSLERHVTNSIRERRNTPSYFQLTAESSDELMQHLWLLLDQDDAQALMKTCRALHASGHAHDRQTRLYLKTIPPNYQARGTDRPESGDDTDDETTINCDGFNEVREKQAQAFRGWDDKEKIGICFKNRLLVLHPRIGSTIAYDVKVDGREVTETKTFCSSSIPKHIYAGTWKVALVRCDDGSIVDGGCTVDQEKCSVIRNKRIKDKFAHLSVRINKTSQDVRDANLRFRLHVELHACSKFHHGPIVYKFCSLEFKIRSKYMSQAAWEEKAYREWSLGQASGT